MKDKSRKFLEHFCEYLRELEEKRKALKEEIMEDYDLPTEDAFIIAFFATSTSQSKLLLKKLIKEALMEVAQKLRIELDKKDIQ